MILTIDEVKNTRFRMATRRSGYEAADVDVFVDKVEATLHELTDERDTLARQLESVTSTVGSGANDEELRQQLEAKDAELEELRGQLFSAAQSPVVDTTEIDRLHAELQGKDAEIAALSSGGDEVARLRSDLEARNAEIGSLQDQLGYLRDAAASSVGGTEHLVVSTAADAAPAVTRLLQMATEQSERLVAEAKADAERAVGEAQRQAHEVIADAQRRSEQLVSDAQSKANGLVSDAEQHAERVTRDANAYAEQVNKDADARRQEVFATLENERDDFANKVDHLRQFESRFRETFISSLEDHLGRLRSGSMQPDDLPDLMNPGQRAASPTPRLDALMGKGQDS